MKPATVAGGGEAGKAKTLGAALPAYELGRVEPGTYGPVSVSLQGGTLSVWASPKSKERVWHARVVESDGHASTKSIVIGKTGLELGLVTLVPVAQGLQGLLAYSVQPTEQTTTLHAVLLGPSGEPKSAFTELTTMGSALLWTQIVDTARGPIVFYAVARTERAEIRATGLTPEGKLRFADREVIGGLRAWQITAAPDGAALAVVHATNHGHGGIVQMYLLDQTANIAKGPIELEQHPSAELDLDLTRVGRNYVLAWSDRKHIDSRILVAAVDPTGNVVTSPRPAVAGIGEQTLVKIVPPANAGRAVLVWENPSLPFQRRMLSLAEIDDTARVDQRVVHLACSSRSSTLPEIIATPGGISALTFDDFDEATGHESLEPMPTYVELGAGLVPRAAVPLVLEVAQGKTVVPLLAWGLDCRHGCRATAALDDSPVPIATIPLSDAARRPNAGERARRLVVEDAGTLPRLERLDSIAEVEPLADLAAAPTNEGFLVSAVTYFDPTTPLKRLTKPGSDGRTDPLQARVDVFPIASEDDFAFAQTISYRGSSLPGLSVVAGKTQPATHGVAWSAVDQGQPQLFLSTVGGDGKKLQQRMLTHKKGRLDEIALAPLDDGWLLAWSDERANQLDLYALRVNKTLERRGAEQRLNTGRGDVSALALVPMQNEALIVFAVAQNSAQCRGADLITRRISLQDAQPIGPEQRVAELSGVVKFLSATRHKEGVVIGWLEVPADAGLADKTSTLRWMRLDGKGGAITHPSALPATDAVPTSLAVDCPNERCHGVLVADVGGRGELRGWKFDPETTHTPKPVPLARSLGTVEQNVAPVLVGDHVFMVDQIDAERARIVHAKLKWE